MTNRDIFNAATLHNVNIGTNHCAKCKLAEDHGRFYDCHEAICQSYIDLATRFYALNKKEFEKWQNELI